MSFEFLPREIRSGSVPLELTGEGRFVISRKEFIPAYIKTYEEGRLREKVEEALELLRSCHVCPRDCQVDRLQNKTGVCKSGRLARVASAFTHFGEEDCLRGWRGSGTIFFAWCNLRCVFCQNFETSQQGEGTEVTAAQLAAIILRLQKAGCHNINFVTPEHVVPQILEALPLAIEGGLRLPIVYNTSAYDSADSLALMDGVVDIYMPDFKFWDREMARQYMKAPDYPEAARRTIREMHRQVGPLVFDESGLALRGLLIRHLVMPGDIAGTQQILEWIARELAPGTYVDLMDQYYPSGKVSGTDYVEISRRITPKEYRLALEAARHAGLRRLDERAPAKHFAIWQ